jgi:hypothetical protein
MKIAKRRTLEEIYPADWSNFAEDIGMRAPFVRRRVEEIATAILGSLDKALNDLGLPLDRHGIATNYSSMIQKRASFTAELP